jgi:hypothetical protein
MRILRANLKQLYQRRGLWVAYAFFALFAFVSCIVATDERVAGEGRFVGLILLAFLVGLVVATHQREIVAKPFGSCLPGHRQVLRQFIFVVGGAANLVSCLLFLLYPGLPWGLVPMVLGAAFCAGMVFYLGGVWFAFHSNQPMAFAGLLFIPVVVAALLKMHIFLEQAIVEYPLWVILFGLLCGSAMWVALNNDDLVRRNCLRLWIGFDDAFSKDRAHRFQRAELLRRLKDHPRPWVEGFFLGRIDRRPALSLARFIWGQMYVSFAISVSQWRSTVLLVLFIAVFLGYNWVIGLATLVGIPIGIAVQSRPALYSNLLVGRGREERFISTLASVLAVTGVLTVLAGMMVLASVPLAGVMPEFCYKGLYLAYRAVDVRVLCLPLVLVPLGSAIHLLFYRKPIVMLSTLVIVLYAAAMLGFRGGKSLRDVLTPQTILIVASLSWLAFILVTRHIAMRWSLVK